MNRRRRLSGRAGRDPAFLPARDETSSGKSSLLRPVFGKEEFDEVIALAIPALGSLLADPLMSLVDTAVVGRYSSTSLAALGPSTAVFQIVFQVRSSFIFIIWAIRQTDVVFCVQLFSFLSITTTGMVARACAGGDNSTVRRALANSTILAVTFGGLTCLGLNLFAPAVLGAMGCSPDLVAAATPYLRIRAMAIPAVLFCTSAQGGCLGLQDAKTPLLIFTLAGVVNVFGDFYAVGTMGLRGAAWATLAAQYVSAGAFFVVLTKRRMLPLKLGHWRLPSREEMRNICSISGMLLLGSLCRMGVYTMMTMTALKIGSLTMAAHQVALQIFWTLTYFVDPLFVAATSFIARDHGRRPDRVRRMASLLLRLSVGVGAFIARGVLPHTGVRRAGVHDGPGPRVHDQVHRAVDGHVSAHQRGGAGHGRDLDRLRGFAVFAQGALLQLCGARGVAVVGTARGAGPARDMDRGVCEPAVTSESARGARVAGRGARPSGSIRGEDGYDGRRRRRHLMGSRTTSIPSFFFKYFLRVTGGERPSPPRPKRSVVTTFSFKRSPRTLNLSKYS